VESYACLPAVGFHSPVEPLVGEWTAGSSALFLQQKDGQLSCLQGTFFYKKKVNWYHTSVNVMEATKFSETTSQKFNVLRMNFP
jgi:hypothetical protein